MGRFIEGCDRRERQLLPDCVDDYVSEESPVRVIDVFCRRTGFGGAWFCRRGDDGAARLSSGDDAQAVSLWLSQSGAVEPAAARRDATLSRCGWGGTAVARCHKITA